MQNSADVNKTTGSTVLHHGQFVGIILFLFGIPEPPASGKVPANTLLNYKQFHRTFTHAWTADVHSRQVSGSMNCMCGGLCGQQVSGSLNWVCGGQSGQQMLGSMDCMCGGQCGQQFIRWRWRAWEAKGSVSSSCQELYPPFHSYRTCQALASCWCSAVWWAHPGRCCPAPPPSPSSPWSPGSQGLYPLQQHIHTCTQTGDSCIIKYSGPPSTKNSSSHAL